MLTAPESAQPATAPRRAASAASVAALPKIARRQAVRAYLRGKRCYGGLDLSKSTDLTAFVLLFPPQPGLETWVALFWAWRPEDGVVEAEQRDHVPYRDWARAGFLELCEGDIVDYNGTLYKSLVDGNVWTPGAYDGLWEVYPHAEQP